MSDHQEKLALLGGPKACSAEPRETFPVPAQEVKDAVGRLIDAGVYSTTAEEPYKALEREWAEYCNAKHCLAQNNGTSTLWAALWACGVGPGDEVITVPNTYVATIFAITYCGATPVFVDIDPATYNMNVAQIEAKITPRTKAILPVHLYGQPADMDPLMALAERHGLCVVEDAAQAHGARYHGRRVGSLGHIACFSFYPGKNLGAYGDGGAVVTDNVAWAAQVRVLGDHGRTGYYEHQYVGCNSRLDALQAAVLRVKLRHLDDWNAARRRAAECYRARLASLGDVVLPYEAPGREHVYHLYVVRTPGRDALRQRLTEAGIQSGLHYPVPLHLQPAYGDLDYARGSLPRSEAWTGEIVSLPIYAELDEGQIESVCRVLKRSGV
jgi:dTDP-4-amino-4,6-dideoxygalactose transaminase